MPLKSVAVEGDASAVTGSGLVDPADEGEWTAGPVIVTTYDHFTSEGPKVIYEAECTFTFAGMDTDPNPPVAVPGTETITLTADGTTLQSSLDKVLVDGDETDGGDYGNKIVVSASGLLRTHKD